MKYTTCFASQLGSLLLACSILFVGCTENDTQRATSRLEKAQEYADSGQLNNARREIDSIHILYPKVVEVRRQAKHLSDSIAYVEAVRTYAYSDSVRNVLSGQADKLLKKFRYEKNSTYEDKGKYVHRLLQTSGYNTSRCYLQCYVGDDRTTTLKSYYYGTKAIRHEEITLSSEGENINDKGSNHTFENEGWHEILSFDEEASLRLLNFISTHKSNRIRVQLAGTSPYTYYLQDNEKTALDETYHLGLLMHDIKQIEDAMRTADRTIGKWENKVSDKYQ